MIGSLELALVGWRENPRLRIELRNRIRFELLFRGRFGYGNDPRNPPPARGHRDFLSFLGPAQILREAVFQLAHRNIHRLRTHKVTKTSSYSS